MRKFLFTEICIIFLVLVIVLPSFAYVDITPQDAKKRIDAGENLFIMDVRQPEEYATGYVPNAVLIPLGEVAQRLGEIPRDKPVIVVCKSGGRSAQVSKILDDNGFKSVFNVLGGTSAWKAMPSYLYITPQDLRDQLDDANKFIVDVRTIEEYKASHIAVAISMPLGDLKDRMNEIPMDKEIIVVAENNDQGDQSAGMFISAGYKNVKNMSGGMPNWNFESSVSSKKMILTTFAKIKTGR